MLRYVCNCRAKPLRKYLPKVASSAPAWVAMYLKLRIRISLRFVNNMSVHFKGFRILAQPNAMHMATESD